MFELVGDHREPCPRRLERRKRLPDPSVDLGVIGDVAAVVGEVALQEAVEAPRLGGLALGFEAAL